MCEMGWQPYYVHDGQIALLAISVGHTHRLTQHALWLAVVQLRSRNKHSTTSRSQRDLVHSSACTSNPKLTQTNIFRHPNLGKSSCGLVDRLLRLLSSALSPSMTL